MPWPAAPWKSGSTLMTHFQCSNIPSLIVVSFDGKFLSRYGRDDVLRVGIEALRTRSRGEKLASLLADNYKWLSVTCEGCKMFPLVGQRHHCPTCANYDLLSICKKNGHEHPLVFQP